MKLIKVFFQRYLQLKALSQMILVDATANGDEHKEMAKLFGKID